MLSGKSPLGEEGILGPELILGAQWEADAARLESADSQKWWGFRCTSKIGFASGRGDREEEKTSLRCGQRKGRTKLPAGQREGQVISERMIE